MHEIIFYNGFNLLVDIMLAWVVGVIAYRSGVHAGYLRGYGEGQDDYREEQERHADWTGWDD